MSVPNVNAFLHFYQPEPPPHLKGKAHEKYIKKRKFYSCNSDNGYDYVNYVNTGSKHKEDYVEYSGDDEKSKGLFSINGKLSKKEKKELKKQLQATKSVIWDLVISFQPEFGQKYCNDYDSAYAILKTVMPKFLKRAGFNLNNIVWYAGLHENKRHRHIHISFFEKEPKRYHTKDKELHYSEGYIPQSCLTFLKIQTEQKATDITAELKALRKSLTQAQSLAIGEQLGKSRYQTEFRKGLAELMLELPKNGRLGYDSDNMASVRPKVDKLVDYVIKSDKNALETFNEFNSVLLTRDIKTREMLARNKISEKSWAKYMVADKYLSDIYRRLGNQVINAVRVFRQNETTARSHIARKRMENAREQRLLDYSIKLQISLETDAILAFNEYMKELEHSKDLVNETY